MPKVNQDYLCLIRVKAGKTSFEKENIPQSVELVSSLEEMSKNPNQTVLDMQSRMNLTYPLSQRHYISYVSPFSYDSSFISGTSYPSSRSSEEYEKELSDKEEELKLYFEERNKDLKSSNSEDYSLKMQEYISDRMQSYKESIKLVYLNSAKRFIMARNYTETLSKLKAEAGVKMYSTDTLGWSDFEYKVTDDVIITVGTNFGYGQSSYFRLGLRYKGIDILPYSYVVRYYFADMADIIRYTRIYDVVRDSWSIAFEFVARMANLAAADPDAFIQETVVNEVKEMVGGLRKMLEPSSHFMDNYTSSARQKTDCDYLTVRNMYGDELSTYKAFPEEMSMAVKAEKVTGSLAFLDNLRSLSTTIPCIEDAIKEICEMARLIIPGIEAMIMKLSNQISTLELKLEKKAEEIEFIKDKIEPHNKEIDRLFNLQRLDNEDIFRYMVEASYRKDHQDYIDLQEKHSALLDEKHKLENEMLQRKSFRTQLEKCISSIDEDQLSEAA